MSVIGSARGATDRRSRPLLKEGVTERKSYSFEREDDNAVKKKMSRDAEAKTSSAEPKALTDSEYKCRAGFCEGCVKNEVRGDNGGNAANVFEGRKPPGTPMNSWFFGQNMNDIIEQEEMYLNLLRLRAINIDDVLETEKLRRQLQDISEKGSLAEDRSKYECWQDGTMPGANTRRMARPWNVGEGCRFDRFDTLGFKRDASTLHLRVHWIAKRVKNLEIVLDWMGEEAPEILRDTVDDGRCLTWLLITDRGGTEEIIVSIRSRADTSDSSEPSGKKKR